MRVTVVIRTYNEAANIARTLSAVRAQREVEPVIVVVDSGSTDDTCRLVREFPARLIELPRESFSYGRSLNTGFAAADTPLVANLSAHALPFDRHWLRNLVRPLADPQVDGVVGKTLPHPDCNPFDRRGLLRAYGTEPRALYEGGALGFSNANGAIRREAWEETPFDETLPYSEDYLWARRRMGLGRRLVYAPDAAVYHSHNDSPGQLRRRFWAEGRSLEMIQPRDERYTLRRLVWDFFGGLLYDWATLLRGREAWRWFGEAPRRRLAVNLGRYAGSRGIELTADGRAAPRLLDRFALRLVRAAGAAASRLAPWVVVATRKHPRPLHPKHLLPESRDHFWYADELAGGRVALDVGCNVGVHASFAARQGLSVIGMDIDPKALGHARFMLAWEGAARTLVAQADAERPFPFADASFDRVIAFDVIEHLADAAGLLAEIRRVLTPDGVLLLTAPNAMTSWKRRCRRAGLPFFADPTHQHEYTRDGLRATLAEAGFTVTRETPIVADTPAAPWYDLAAAVSLTWGERLAARKRRQALAQPEESTGFRLAARLTPPAP